jgi:hypothetical protein
VQFDGVAVAAKLTTSGAVPEEGAAVAMQVREHGDETTIEPVFKQVVSSAVAIMVHG